MIINFYYLTFYYLIATVISFPFRINVAFSDTRNEPISGIPSLLLTWGRI